MTLDLIKDRLESIVDLKSVAYHHFISEPQEPYAVFYENSATLYGADNKNLLKNCEYIIEVYTSLKNPDIEKKIETKFDDVELSKAESFLDDDKVYMISYTFRKVRING